jgi:hypothetical protein
MAEKVVAQRWRWRRSDGDGGAAMAMAAQQQHGSAATAMAMAAQRWGWQWWQWRQMSIALLSLRVAAHLLPMDALLSSPTDVRDVFCIFLLSLHIFNVGIPYTQTDGWTDTNRRQFNHFFYRLVKLSLTRSIRVTINCFINYTRNNKLS